jgi:hypothetical protein
MSVHMTSFRSLAFCAAALAVGGCKKDATFTEPIGPLASITWTNAVSDTGQLDIRVIDIPSNAALFDANFRTSLIYPQGIEAGPRRIKVFISSTNPDSAKLYLVDTTVTFTADARYSFYVTGFSRTGQTPAVQALILPATPPAMAAGQFAIRVLNLAPRLAGATLPDTTVAPDALIKPINVVATGTPEVTNVPYLGVSSYVVLDTGRYQLALTGTGSGAAPFVAAPVLPGTRGTTTTDAIGGSVVAGTVLTAVILPRSVVGSKAPNPARPTLRATDTSVAEATRRVSRSNDTVTVQSGSIQVLTNRSPVKPDSTVGGTGTRAATATARGDVVLVTGATQPEYNGWFPVLSVADTLVSCSPTDPGDTATRCNAPNAIATTRFRFRYKILGTPVSPATGAPQYRVYPPLTAGGVQATDFTLPYVMFIVDQRPPSTTP